MANGRAWITCDNTGKLFLVPFSQEVIIMGLEDAHGVEIVFKVSMHACIRVPFHDKTWTKGTI